MEKKLQEFDLQGTQQMRQPKHERLRQYLVAGLTAGHLKPGQAIPSEHSLAAKLEISRTTVRQAMSTMERDGLIRRVQGKGTFVDDQAHLRLQRNLEAFALIVPETRAGSYPSLLEGFEESSKKVNNQVLVCSTQNNLSKQAEIVLQLLHKKVAGVAIVPTSRVPTPLYQIQQLQEQGVPVVFCHRRVEGIRAPLLKIPFRQIGRLAGEALAQRGHRRAAFFVHRPSVASQGYEAGLRTAMRAHGGDLAEQFVYRGSPKTPELVDQEDAMQEALERMLGVPDRPTGIMTSFDSVGEMVYLLLGRIGMRMPDDVSLVSFGGTRRDSAILRQLTSVAVDEGEIGRRAAGLLSEMRSGQRPIEDEEEIIMKLVLTEGQTLGPIQGSSSING